jgi:putative SOS response-associated peptidase YedK
MCGRAYETYTDEELYFRYSSKRTTLPPRSPVYNLCPTMNSPVLRVVSGLRKFDEMRWPLVPSTEPAFTTKLSTINARSEGVFQSRLYRDLVIRQRCILPLFGMPHAAYRLLCRAPDYAESVSQHLQLSGNPTHYGLNCSA